MMPSQFSTEFTAALVPFKRRLRWRGFCTFIQKTLWLSLALSTLILLTGRLFPIENTRWFSFLPLFIWVLLCLGYALWFRPSDLRTALRLDIEHGLKESLSSCLALSSPRVGRPAGIYDAELFERLRAGAQQTLRSLQPKNSFPIPFYRRPMAAAAVLLAAALVLAFVPNPMDGLIAERRAAAQAASAQAAKIEALNKEIEKSTELSPEEKENLRKLLEELAKKLKENRGDREKALADLNSVEQALRERLDPNVLTKKAALEAIAARLQAMAGLQKGERLGDMEQAGESLEKLADQMSQMDAKQLEQLAKDLAQLSARAAQAGDPSLAQALAAMAQAAQSGNPTAGQQAAQSAQQALSQAQKALNAQQALQQTLQKALASIQSGRQALAPSQQSGQQRAATGGQSGQGNQPGNQGQGQNAGQNQGNNPGGQTGAGGGGTRANSLPPGTSQGRPGLPNQRGAQTTGTGELDQQVYVPREKTGSKNTPLSIEGTDTGSGEEQTRESAVPMPGSNNPSLVPYRSVYQSYLETAGQALEQSYIPSNLKDYVRSYFSQLEP